MDNILFFIACLIVFITFFAMTSGKIKADNILKLGGNKEDKH